MDRTEIESFTHARLLKLIEIKNPTGLEEDLLIIGDNHADSNLLKYPCRINSLVALVCQKGEMVVNINLNEYHIQPGTMILNIPQNIVQLKEQKECMFYGISISTSFFEKTNFNTCDLIPVYTQIRNEPCLQLTEEENDIFCKFISLIQLIGHSSESPQKKTTIRELSTALINQLYDTILKRKPIAELESKKSRQEIIFGKFITLLAQYHMSERSVTFYAEQLCITPKYFSSLVKKLSGKSAAQWIDNYVILEAKNLLKYSDMSIQEIAYRLNFSTQSFFGKYFKHQTGLSPTQYRTQT